MDQYLGDECPYCGCTDCSGHDPEDAKSLCIGKLTRRVGIEFPGDEGDEPCPYCGDPDCAGHPDEDGESLYLGKMAAWMGGDEPCPFCGNFDCAGHMAEDVGTSGFEKLARWAGDELLETEIMFRANVLY